MKKCSASQHVYRHRVIAFNTALYSVPAVATKAFSPDYPSYGLKIIFESPFSDIPIKHPAAPQ
jgi:hypothetical protein